MPSASAVISLRRIVDRPVGRRYLGACMALLGDGTVCGYELRAEIDDSGKTAAWVRCGRCREQYEVARIEADARAAAEDLVYTLAELVRVTAAIGAPIPNPTLYRWARKHTIAPRGWQHRDAHTARITDHPIGLSDQRVYRLGEVLAVARHGTNGHTAIERNPRMMVKH